ncbi:MAG: type II secretion system protein GspL, partial [Desulfosarcinaceae bacterium]
MSRQILAIDIRNEAVAAVLINTGLKNTTIQRYAYVQQNGSSEEAPTIQTTLKTIYENLAADDPTCVVSLPADQLFFRNTSLPFSDDKKIRQILPFELETVLPVSIDNLVIDYQKGLEEQRTEVVAVAIEQEKLQAYITELEASAIHPQLIVPCSFPLVLSLLEHDQQMPAHALLLDVGHHLADL